MKLSRLPKAVKLAAIPVAIALVATPVLALTQNEDVDKDMRTSSSHIETKKKDDTQEPAPVEPVTQNTVNQPVQKQEQTQAQIQENPYPVGLNIWHAFNRRTELGLEMPEGPPSDGTYWQGVKDRLVRVPTIHAIAFTGTQRQVAGVVEDIGEDGSLTLSCTNCGQWNVLSTRKIPADNAKSYVFLP